MKRVLLLFVAHAVVLLTGCKVTTDYIFDDISTHRITQYIEECDAVLQKAPHGWKFVYYPDTTQFGAYTFLIRFLDDNRVEMHWDGDDEVTESTYGFNTSQGPLLCFETYGLLHRLADPNPSVAGGAIGLGFGGEYEFMIREATEEQIRFLTRKEKREVAFVRATEEDWEQLNQNRTMIRRFEVDRDAPVYQYLQIGDKLAFFSYSQKLRMAYIAYPEGDKTISIRLPWESTPNSIRFNREVTFGGVTFSEVTKDIYGDISIPNEPSATFFRADNYQERCRLRFPGGVKSTQHIDGYNLVERGRALDYLTPSGRGIEYFRFYWNLVGYAAGELYIRNDNGICLMAGLYISDIVDDGIGDQVTFTKHRSSNSSGPIDETLNQWFGGIGGYFPGTLTNYLATSQGFTIIPFGDQFYMIRNNNNMEWCLYSRKKMVE